MRLQGVEAIAVDIPLRRKRPVKNDPDNAPDPGSAPYVDPASMLFDDA